MKENTGITINSNVTINIETAGNAEAAQPIVNHDEDVLVASETSLFELLEVLRNCPDAVEAEKDEIECKEEEAKLARLKEVIGKDFDVNSDASENAGNQGEGFSKGKRRPGPVQLWNNYHRVATCAIGTDGRIDVYTNGYAVYDNGDRRSVIWVPDCGSVTYYFGQLRDNEREYLKQKDEVGKDILGAAPWYIALTVAGEDSIERNLVHPKSQASASAFEAIEEGIRPDYSWRGGAHIETPEEALIRKENERERREALTGKQREVYDLYFNEGLTQRQIAEKLGISHRAVGFRLKGALEHFEKNPEKFF